MFQSRTYLTYFCINIVEIGTIWTLWALNYTKLPELVPFNLLTSWGENQLVLSTQLWQLPAYMTVCFIVCIGLSWFFWKREKIYAQFIIASLCFVNFIALLSFVRIIVRFT